MSKAILSIDVSKKDLSLCLFFQDKHYTKKISNDLEGFKTLKTWLHSKDIVDLIACLEATGHYGRKLLTFYTHDGTIIF